MWECFLKILATNLSICKTNRARYVHTRDFFHKFIIVFRKTSHPTVYRTPWVTNWDGDVHTCWQQIWSKHNFQNERNRHKMHYCGTKRIWMPPMPTFFTGIPKICWRTSAGEWFIWFRSHHSTRASILTRPWHANIWKETHWWILELLLLITTPKHIDWVWIFTNLQAHIMCLWNLACRHNQMGHLHFRSLLHLHNSFGNRNLQVHWRMSQKLGGQKQSCWIISNKTQNDWKKK